MSEDNGQKQPQHPEGLPDFKPEYFWAFATIMLYKLGGFEVLTLKQLEKYNYEKDCPQITWDDKNKAFIMRLKDQIEKSQTISVPGKIRKKLLRQLIKNNFG